MTVTVTALRGVASEPRYAGRRHVAVAVAWDEASRRRLRRTAADGTDVAIALARAEYLADGAVLDDDGERLLVVARTPESALIVRFDDHLSAAQLVGQALRVGHAFGNQHVPIDVVDGEARVPLTTSERIARQTIAALGLEGVEIDVADVALGAQRALPVGHSHAGGHHHEHDGGT